MKIREAIQKLDELKPNSYSELDKIRWLSQLDGSIQANLFDIYEDSPTASALPYGENTSLETELLVEYPYDELYIHWLAAQIDRTNDELNNYNNDIATYGSLFSEYRNHFNRTHKAKRKNYQYF